jgi:hypothetical protein
MSQRRGDNAVSQLRTLLRLLPWVIGSAVAAVLGLLRFRTLVPPETLRASNDVVGNYLQTLGGIYAVLLAFVVYAVWQQFNDARAQVEREASEAAELLRITRALPDAARNALRRRLHDYVCGVLDNEWGPSGERRALHERSKVAKLLDSLWDELTGLEPQRECEKIVVSEALNCFNELCNARTSRISTSQLRMPRPLRLLLYIGALIVSCSTWLFAVDLFAVHAFITGATAAAISHVLYVIEDLDDCFSGEWQVPRAPLLRLREQSKHELESP